MRTTNLDEASSAPFDFALTRRPEFSSPSDDDEITAESAPSLTQLRARKRIRGGGPADTSATGPSGTIFTFRNMRDMTIEDIIYPPLIIKIKFLLL